MSEQPTPAAAKATPKKASKKSPPKKPEPDKNVVTLRALCVELKCDPRDARVKLRAAVKEKKIKHAAKKAWEWNKGDSELKVVRDVLKGRD
jgi:hypothetical protein